MRIAPTCLLVAALGGGCRFDPAGVAGGDDVPIDGPVDPGADGPAGDDAARADAPPASGRYRKPLTVPAAQVTGSLSDFPVLIARTDPDLRDHAGASGADLHFVDADGQTVLDHELVAWDSQTGRLEAWVRLPALSGAGDTTFDVQYGAFASPPGEDAAGVWSNGFLAVWHLEETPGGGAGDIADALDARDATSAGMGAANSVAGVIGRGLAFEGGPDGLTFTSPFTGSSPHTFSAWIDQETTTQNNALIVIGDGACTEARWLHGRFDGGPVAAGFYCDDWATTGVDIQGDGWTLIHWTYSAGGQAQSRLYRDGAAAAGPFDHAGTQSTDGAAGHIGNAPNAFGSNMGLRGRLDEVRIAGAVRSAAWIAAEHASQSAPETFVVAGAEEPLP